MELRNIFKSAVRGVNVITPHVIGFFGDGENIVIELSTDDNYETKTIFGEMYGVTVVRHNDDGWYHDIDSGDCFSSVEDAKRYIDKLIEEVKNDR